MDRKKKQVTYLSSMNATLKTSKRKKPSKKRKPMSARMRMAIVVLFLLALLAVFVAYALRSVNRTAVGRVMRIGATLNQNIMPFGDDVVFYDGTTLHCVAGTGGNKWSYQIGTNADYDASENTIAAWSGNDLYILNERGSLIYNNKTSDDIQFASAGEDYVAAFVGDADNGVVTVINKSGQTVDNITIENQVLLDIGFFHAVTSSSAQAVELMWILGLDTTGTVISCELQTFQPGKLATGKSSLGEHLIYRIYDVDGILSVVNTRQIMHYNYRVVEQSDPTLIYGYTVEDVREENGVTYQLLIPAQEQSQATSISNVRLIYGNTDRVMHLPGACLSASLGSRSVYGFAANAVYACRFNETTFSSYALPIEVTAVLGMISDNRVIVASGSEIYVIELPT